VTPQPGVEAERRKTASFRATDRVAYSAAVLRLRGSTRDLETDRVRDKRGGREQQQVGQEEITIPNVGHSCAPAPVPQRFFAARRQPVQVACPSLRCFSGRCKELPTFTLRLPVGTDRERRKGGRLVVSGDTFTAAAARKNCQAHGGVWFKCRRRRVDRCIRAGRPWTCGFPTETSTRSDEQAWGWRALARGARFSMLLGARPVPGRSEARCLVVAEVAQAHDGAWGSPRVHRRDRRCRRGRREVPDAHCCRRKHAG